VNVDPKLLELLACPRCKRPVAERDGELECTGCGARYPVRDGLPVLLPRDD